MGDRVGRESSVIGRKLVRRCKQDGLGRWGFTIAGRRERGSMRQDKLKDGGREDIAQGAGLPFKLCRATSGVSGCRLLRPVRPDVSFCIRMKRVRTSTPTIGVYVVCACSVRRIERACCSRTQVGFFADVTDGWLNGSYL